MSTFVHVRSIVETPVYHRERLYDIVWDTGAKIPAVVCDIKDLPPETYEMYLRDETEEKISVLYFTQSPNDV